MKRGVLVGALLGFMAGLAAAILFFQHRTALPPASHLTPTPAPSKKLADQADQILQLQQEAWLLKRTIAELQSDKHLEQSLPASKLPNPDQRHVLTLQEKFAKLAKGGLDAIGSPDHEELMSQVSLAKRDCIPFLLEMVQRSPAWEERYYAALLLPIAGCSDPSSVNTLAEALRGEQDVFVRRVVARALSHSENDLAEGPLREVMTSDRDSTVRLQAAYGLAKIGRDDGRQVLERAYTSQETAPECRRAALMWLASAPSPASAPLFRRILSETRAEADLSRAISGLAKLKDVTALPALQNLASSDLPGVVREEAKKAIAEIQK